MPEEEGGGIRRGAFGAASAGESGSNATRRRKHGAASAVTDRGWAPQFDRRLKIVGVETVASCSRL